MKAEAVNVYDGDTRAIIDTNLDVHAREVLALMGPSGCGKSSFLRCLNRMYGSVEGPRVTGLITLDGVDIHGHDVDPVQIRARVGMVAQAPNPFPKSIYDNVACGPRLHGLHDSRQELDDLVVASLRRAGLWDEMKDHLDQPGTGLSGGQQQRQQQRLCIARAISDRTAYFYLGELVEVGETMEPFENPREERTRRYMAGIFG